MSDPTRHFVDAAGASGVLATIIGWLPLVPGLIVTLLAGVWYGMQIYDWVEGKRHARQRTD